MIEPLPDITERLIAYGWPALSKVFERAEKGYSEADIAAHAKLPLEVVQAALRSGQRVTHTLVTRPAAVEIREFTVDPIEMDEARQSVARSWYLATQWLLGRLREAEVREQSRIVDMAAVATSKFLDTIEGRQAKGGAAVIQYISNIQREEIIEAKAQ